MRGVHGFRILPLLFVYLTASIVIEIIIAQILKLMTDDKQTLGHRPADSHAYFKMAGIILKVSI